MDIGRFENASLVWIILRQMLTDEPVQLSRTQRPFTINCLDDFADDLFDGVKISLRFQRVGHPIKFPACQLGIVVLGIVFIMFEADG